MFRILFISSWTLIYIIVSSIVYNQICRFMPHDLSSIKLNAFILNCTSFVGFLKEANLNNKNSSNAKWLPFSSVFYIILLRNIFFLPIVFLSLRLGYCEPTNLVIASNTRRIWARYLHSNYSYIEYYSLLCIIRTFISCCI